MNAVGQTDPVLFASPRPKRQIVAMARDPSRLLMIGIPGPDLDYKARDLLDETGAGGVVLFRRNFVDAERLRRLTRDLRAHRRGEKLLVAIDHEGGRVDRLSPPFTRFPPARELARAGSTRLAAAVGRAMGEELRWAGVDIDFAPVLDVDSNPNNPIIGDRAFATEPETAARFGMAVARGLLRAGVAPCGKHFPGHGDTAVDSHLDLPVVSKSRRELDRVEIAAFCRAIEAGIPALMTAHVLYPALDAKLPATLSSRILDDLLRQKLGFRGVVFSDDLDMKALSDRWDSGEAAVRSIEAGADVLLVCESSGRAKAVAAALREAAARPGFARRVRESLARVDRLRGRIERRRRATPLPRLRADDADFHAALAHRIARRHG